MTVMENDSMKTFTDEEVKIIARRLLDYNTKNVSVEEYYNDLKQYCQEVMNENQS